MTIQRTADAVAHMNDVPRDTYTGRTRLMLLASEMAFGTNMPSPLDESHPKQRPRKYWLLQLERAREEYRRCALELNECLVILRKTKEI